LIWSTAGRDVRFLGKSTLVTRHPISPVARAAGAIPVYRRIDEGVDITRRVETFAAAIGARACRPSRSTRPAV
jgi:hypothetical protein